MIEIKPVSEFLTYSIEVPGSKSLTNRALLIGSMSQGEVVLHNILYSDDTRYMIESLRSFGADIRTFDHTVIIDSDCKKLRRPKKPLYVGNAGTVMRFLTAFSTLIPGDVEITGDERMSKRPIFDLVESLRELGADILYLGKSGFPPLLVKESRPHGGTISIRGDMSSQFASALLMIAPCIGEDITIQVEGPLVSRPYIDMTIRLMDLFGIHVQYENSCTFVIHPSAYKAQTYTIEGDASSAGYYWAMGFLHERPLTVTNVPEKSLQGDTRFKNLLEILRLAHPKEIDMNDMPDCVQTLAVILATIPVKTRIKNVFNLRLKETDRIHALATELKKIGAKVHEGNDYIDITGNKHPHGAEIETCNDHRMAMSFAVLGTKISGIKIKNPECVSKSYPDFWKDLEKLGIQIIKH